MSLFYRLNKIHFAQCIALFTVIFCMNGFAGSLLPSEQNTIRVFKRFAPYVVFVQQQRPRSYFSRSTLHAPSNNGSGFIWGNKGYIVTNAHVVRGSGNIVVQLADGSTVKAKRIGADARNDIAVLRMAMNQKIKAQIPRQTLKWVAENTLKVGQKAIAIGNPFGLSQTLTDGVVSALDRDLPGQGGVDILDMIQTDASINPGNSGGPLLDSMGDLIGMNTMMYSLTGGYSGVGFAVPANTIARSVVQIIKHGYVSVPGIGITPVSDEVARANGVTGVVILNVQPRSPAMLMGLRGLREVARDKYQMGDVIMAVNGKTVSNYNDYYRVISQVKIGSKVALIVERGDRKRSVKVRVVNYANS